MKKEKILIVDAFSGGRLFAEIASKEFDLENYHLLSNINLPNYYQKTFEPKFFSQQFVWEENKIDSIIDTLRNLKISAVIAGTETGVEVADFVSDALNLKGNGINKSKARRSKSLMHECAKQYGIRVPNQILTNELNEALNFAKSFLNFPLVIKPDTSAGSDGFNIVEDIETMKNIFKKLQGTTNRLGLINNKILIQEFIQGEEFAVNTVSSFGQHYVTHIWHYHKKTVGPNKIYDWEEYISPESELGLRITDFVFKTLNSLDINFGAAHTEIMIDNNGPILIESASRVDGICNPILDNSAIGVNQVDLAIMSLVKSEELPENYKKNFKVNGYLANVSLISNSKSEIPVKKINSNLLENLNSFKSVRWFMNIGDSLNKTTDIFTSPGFIYLHNLSKDLLYEDYIKIRSFEDKGLLYET